MAQQKPKTTQKKGGLVETCAKGMYVLLALQAIPAIVFWIIYAVFASRENKTKFTMDEVKGTVNEIIIISGLPETLSTPPPVPTGYKVQFTYNDKIYDMPMRLNLPPDSPPLNIGDTVVLYIINKDVKTATDNKYIAPTKFSTLFLFLASAFTITFLIGLAIYKYAKGFACFLVVLNLLIVILSILKSKKII